MIKQAADYIKCGMNEKKKKKMSVFLNYQVFIYFHSGWVEN